MAWDIDPRLAVYLTTRFAGNDILREHVMRFVLKQPELVADVVRVFLLLLEMTAAQPEAIHFIVNERNVTAGVPELFRV